MASAFDRIVITVPDLPLAEAQYRNLLGVTPLPRMSPGARQRAWLPLPNTVIELVQGNGAPAAISGIVFSEATPGESTPGALDEPVPNPRELGLYHCDASATSAVRRQYPDIASNLLQVDHLVLQTADASACVALFRDQLGIRLALDKTAPEWGGRMLFFRAGKLTLEVIESDRNRPDNDFFWGIAFQCADLEELARQLAGRGVALSSIRQGRKAGTRVATVKSHCLGIPTLLIEPAPSTGVVIRGR